MPKEFVFIIPVHWELATEMRIEATSLEEAIRIANEADLPEGEYVDGSWEVNEECANGIHENKVSSEMAMVENSPLKDLPLLVGSLRTQSGREYLAEKLKGGSK